MQVRSTRHGVRFLISLDLDPLYICMFCKVIIECWQPESTHVCCLFSILPFLFHTKETQYVLHYYLYLFFLLFSFTFQNSIRNWIWVGNQRCLFIAQLEVMVGLMRVNGHNTYILGEGRGGEGGNIDFYCGSHGS